MQTCQRNRKMTIRFFRIFRFYTCYFFPDNSEICYVRIDYYLSAQNWSLEGHNQHNPIFWLEICINSLVNQIQFAVKCLALTGLALHWHDLHWQDLHWQPLHWHALQYALQNCVDMSYIEISCPWWISVHGLPSFACIVFRALLA